MDWKTKGINWITETEENLSDLQFPGMEREEEQEADRLNQMVKELTCLNFYSSLADLLVELYAKQLYNIRQELSCFPFFRR